jgi:predicted PurR-regulated permease PerM
LISIPAIINIFATGDPVSAIGMAAWAMVMVGGVDNLLNPIIVGKKINIHPLIILFSVLGGISLLGPIGVLIGPITVSLLYAVLSVYNEEESLT